MLRPAYFFTIRGLLMNKDCFKRINFTSIKPDFNCLGGKRYSFVSVGC